MRGNFVLLTAEAPGAANQSILLTRPPQALAGAVDVGSEADDFLSVPFGDTGQGSDKRLFGGVPDISSPLLDLYGPVVVAMRAVRVVQVPLYEVVNMIAVRHGRVSAAGAVHVRVGVAPAMMVGSAGVGVAAADGQFVLLNRPVGKRMVQMSVVEIIDMAFMLDGRMSAGGAVLMRMIGVLGS